MGEKGYNIKDSLSKMKTACWKKPKNGGEKKKKRYTSEGSLCNNHHQPSKNTNYIQTNTRKFFKNYLRVKECRQTRVNAHHVWETKINRFKKPSNREGKKHLQDMKRFLSIHGETF